MWPIAKELNYSRIQKLLFGATEQEQGQPPTVQPQLIPAKRLCMEPQAKQSELVIRPEQTQPPVKGLELRLKSSLAVTAPTKSYDLLKTLGEVNPNTSIKQL